MYMCVMFAKFRIIQYSYASVVFQVHRYYLLLTLRFHSSIYAKRSTSSLRVVLDYILPLPLKPDLHIVDYLTITELSLYDLRCKSVISHSTVTYTDALLFAAYCTQLGNVHETQHWLNRSCRCNPQHVG